MPFRIQPQLFHPFLSTISYCYVVCPCSVWEGTTQNLNTRRQGSLRTFLEAGYYSQPQHVTIFKRSTSFTSKSTEKQLESLLKSLEETKKKELHGGVPSKSSEVPLHSPVSPKSRSLQQLLSKLSSPPSSLTSSQLSHEPAPHLSYVDQSPPLNSQLSSLP